LKEARKFFVEVFGIWFRLPANKMIMIVCLPAKW